MKNFIECPYISNKEYPNVLKISKEDSGISICTDVVGAIPVFYKFLPNLMVTLDPYEIIDKEGCELDYEALKEYFYFKSPLCNRTVCKNVYVTLAYEKIIFDEKRKAFERSDMGLFRKCNNEIMKDWETSKKKLKQIFYEVFEDVVENLKTDQVVIPLSGGYDSRIIAVMLKECSFKGDIVTFSYGPLGNAEAQISKSVAQRLGIKWYFVEYDEDFINTVINSEMFQDYLLFAFKIFSTPVIQDFPAVSYLKDQGILMKDAVFLPGHTGDFIKGKHVSDAFEKIKSPEFESFSRVLFDFHGNRMSASSELLKKIESIMKKYTENPSDGFEIMDWRERQSKFIVNSVRVYEFFGYRWMVPLWDYRLFEFFSCLDNSLRVNGKLYNDVVREFFKKHNVDFPHASEVSKSHMKELLKTALLRTKVYDFVRTVRNRISPGEDRWWVMPGLKRRIVKPILKDFIPRFSQYGFSKRGKEVNAIISDLAFALFLKKYGDKIRG